MIVPLSRKNKYVVSFYYTKGKKNGGVHRKNSQCFIKRLEEGKNGKELEILAKGFAKLSREDQFNKKAGRKIAFTGALFHLFPSPTSSNKTVEFDTAEKN